MFNRKKQIAGLLICSIVLTVLPIEASAASATSCVEAFDYKHRSFSAGAHHVMAETVVWNDTNTQQETVVVEESDKPVSAEAQKEEIDCSNIGVAKVDEYVNIRAKASKDSRVLGKLYKNGIATVLDKKDGWYKIESGSVTGYVSEKYLVVGDAKAYKKAGKKIGTIKADALNLRKKASTDSGVYTLISQGQKVTVLDDSKEGWLKVKYNSYTGYVAAEYVKVKTVYSYAESKAEEKARLEAEEKARKEAEEAAKRREEARKKAEAARKKKEEEARKKYVPPTGGTGQDVVNYALQFVGGPYVLGGSSLTNGIDCSNFVMRVYEPFGVKLPHHSYALRSVGYEVSASEMKPGDIICYSGHVAIYMGDGKIVHAANPKDGIEICNKWNYTYVITIRRIF